MSAGGCDGDAAVEARRHLHVVERQDVGRVRHRQQQGLLVDEADRDGLVRRADLTEIRLAAPMSTV